VDPPLSVSIDVIVPPGLQLYCWVYRSVNVPGVALSVAVLIVLARCVSAHSSVVTRTRVLPLPSVRWYRSPHGW